MSSDLRTRLLLISTAAVLTASGCDRFLRSSQAPEEAAKRETVQIKPDGAECLSDFPDHVGKYLKDAATEKDLEGAFDCLKKSLNTFTSYTEGKSKEHYTGEELRHFLNRYLLKENQISTEFMKEILKLKVFLIGGAQGVLTRSEIDQGLGFTRLVKDEALRLRGHLRFLLFRSSDAQVSGERVQEVKGLVRESVRKLLSESKVSGSVYEFADIKAFMDELQKFVGEGDGLKPLYKWIPLIESLKNLTLGEKPQASTDRLWRTRSDWAVDAYFMTLEYFYLLRKSEFKSPSEWTVLLSFLNRAFDLVEKSPVLETEGLLQARALDRVLEEVWKLDLFKTQIPVATAKITYRMSIIRFLERNQSRQARSSEVLGLDRRHLSMLRFEYNVWRMVQLPILELFIHREPGHAVTGHEISESLHAVDVLREIETLPEGDLQRDLYLQAWDDWRNLVDSDRPVHWTESKGVFMTQDASASRTSFVGLNIMNAVRSLARLVQRGYGEGNSRHVGDLEISERALMNLEEDFRDFGLAVKFLDPRSHNSAGRTFKEASFFTFHGDGSPKLTGHEIFEELNFLISGGSVIAKELSEAALEAKCGTGKIDVLGKPVHKLDCFNGVFRERFETVFVGFPHLIAFVKGLDGKGWDDFHQALFEVASLADKDKQAGTREFSEIRTAAVVLHYVEALMMVYDKDRNQRLILSEVQASAPRFRPFIATVAKKELEAGLGSWLGGTVAGWESIVDDIFYFIVYRGRKPGGAGELARFKFDKQFDLGDIGRLELLKVLAVLKKDVSH